MNPWRERLAYWAYMLTSLLLFLIWSAILLGAIIVLAQNPRILTIVAFCYASWTTLEWVLPRIVGVTLPLFWRLRGR